MELFIILLIIAIVIEIKLEPRLDKVGGRTVIWYNASRFSRHREFIYLTRK